jgi:hypothetical protein
VIPARHLGVPLLVCTLVSLSPDRAAAQSEEGRLTVSLDVDDCTGANRDNVRRVFLIELRTSIPEARLGDASQGAKIQVRCSGPLTVLEISDQVTGKSVTRRIDLSHTPVQGRDRLLALAVMELLVASWAELRTTPKPVVPPVDRRAAAATRRTASVLARRGLVETSPWTTTASVLVGLVRESYGLASGGGLRVMREHRSGYGWAVDLAARTASEDVAIGTVAVRTVSAAASAMARRRARDFDLRAALGVRLGLVMMSGTPDNQAMAEGGQVIGLAAGPMIGFGAGVRPYQQLTIDLSIESGVHVLPVRGLVDDTRAVDVEGPWVITRLAVGWQW